MDARESAAAEHHTRTVKIDKMTAKNLGELDKGNRKRDRILTFLYAILPFGIAKNPI